MYDDRTELLIGIDPGQTSGFAVVTVSRNPELLECGSIKLKNTNCTDVIEELIEKYYYNILREISDEYTIRHIAIEDQYIGINKRTSLILARTAGRWEEAAEVLGLFVNWINPKTWISNELTRGRVTRKSVKIASVAKVKGVYGIQVKDHEADAILIARYCAIKLATNG